MERLDLFRYEEVVAKRFSGADVSEQKHKDQIQEPPVDPNNVLSVTALGDISTHTQTPHI